MQFSQVGYIGTHKAVGTRPVLGSDKDSASVLKPTVVLEGSMRTLKENIQGFIKDKMSQYALHPSSSRYHWECHRTSASQNN